MSGIWADAIRYSADSTRPDPAKFVPPRLPDNYVARTRLLELLDNSARARVTVVSRARRRRQINSPLGLGRAPRRELRVDHTRPSRQRSRHTLGEPLLCTRALHRVGGCRVSRSRLRGVTHRVGCPGIPAAYRQRLAPVGPSAHRKPIPTVRSRCTGSDWSKTRSRSTRGSCDSRSMRPLSSSPTRHRTSVDLATLIEHVDGWATGLVLALSGRSATDAESAAREFLREQVLAKQPEDIQRFLMETAFLEYLSAASTERITKRSDAVDVLRQLEGETAFLSSVEGDHLRYAYQRQFPRHAPRRTSRGEPGASRRGERRERPLVRTKRPRCRGNGALARRPARLRRAAPPPNGQPPLRRHQPAARRRLGFEDRCPERPWGRGTPPRPRRLIRGDRRPHSLQRRDGSRRRGPAGFTRPGRGDAVVVTPLRVCGRRG